MPSTPKNNAGNIVFTEQDDPLHKDVLRSALDNQNAPVLGLVLKVKENADGEEELVNWTFADTSVLKSLALTVLPQSKKTRSNKL